MSIVEPSSNGVQPVNPLTLQAALEMLQKAGLIPTPDPRDKRTVGEVITLYMDALADEVCPQSVENKAFTLNLFSRSFENLTMPECSPLHLKRWLKENRYSPETMKGRWRSDWTVSRACATVQRAFNWARDMRLIRENPFRGVRESPGEPNRPMTDKELRKLLRNTKPYYRRVLLFLSQTGARPSEMAKARWPDVDWKKSVLIIPIHKTVKKTRKPRIIYLSPKVLDLLRWLQRQGKFSSTAEWLYQLLKRRPVRSRVVNRLAKKRGISYRALHVAKKRIGAVCRRKGRGRGYAVYELPSGQVLNNGSGTSEMPYQDHHHADFIFLNSRGRPWNRHALARTLMRLRGKLNIPKSCRLYGIRHMFGRQAILNDVSIKKVAFLMGHNRVATTEHYLTHANDTGSLLEALDQSLNGKSPTNEAG